MGDTLTDMDEFIFANVEEVLFRLAEDLRENYKSELLQSDRVASRKLYQSVRTQVVFGLNSWDVQMSLEDYWKYVENDTRPHWPPRDKILQWIQIKTVIPRPDARGKIPTPQQLSFLISRKIATFGTEGSHDLERTVEGCFRGTWRNSRRRSRKTPQPMFIISCLGYKGAKNNNQE